MIKAIIFDVYETLITHYKTPLYFSKEMAEDASVSYENFMPLWRGSDHERTIGKMTFEEIITRILKVNNCFSEETFNLIYNKRLKTNQDCFKTLHEEIEPLLKQLKARGYKLAIISNCFSEEAPVIKNSLLKDYIDVFCLSHETGFAKPDPAIYHHCLKRLGSEAEECLFVGDGGSDELNGAENVGIKAFQALWYQSVPYYKYQLKTPLELLRVLEIENDC